MIVESSVTKSLVHLNSVMLDTLLILRLEQSGKNMMIVLFNYGEFGRECLRQRCCVLVSVLSDTATWLSEECGFRIKTTYLKLSTKRCEDNLVRNGTFGDVGSRAQENTQRKWKDAFAELLDRGGGCVQFFFFGPTWPTAYLQHEGPEFCKAEQYCAVEAFKNRGPWRRDHAKGTGWKHQFVGSCSESSELKLEQIFLSRRDICNFMTALMDVAPGIAHLWTESTSCWKTDDG